MSRKIILPTIRRLIHPSQKVKQIRCVVIPSSCKGEVPFHCVYVPTIPASGSFTVCTHPSRPLHMHVLTTAMLYRPHRVAPGSWSRCNFHRSATGDATTCPERASSAFDSCAAVPRAKSACLRQCSRSRVRDRSIWPADGAVPAEQRLARKRHRRDDRVRAHGRDRHVHRRMVCDWRRVERRGSRTRSPRCAGGQADARAAVWLAQT
jgi:hypothetical protein